MRAVIVGIAVVVATVAVAGIALLSDGSSSDRPRVMTSHADYVWGDTPRDWVSWADAIAVVEVVGEDQLEHPWDTHESREGFVGRQIRAAIEETIWARPGAEPAPNSVTLKTTDGWWYDHGALVPMKDLGAHRSEVGDRLLVAMFHSKDWGWTLMSGGIPVSADARLRPDVDQTDLGEQLRSMTVQQTVETFRSAKPFADVVRFQHLDIDARMIAVHKYANRAQRASRTP
jgi:hypothetical protein